MQVIRVTRRYMSWRRYGKHARLTLRNGRVALMSRMHLQLVKGHGIDGQGTRGHSVTCLWIHRS